MPEDELLRIVDRSAFRAAAGASSTRPKQGRASERMALFERKFVDLKVSAWASAAQVGCPQTGEADVEENFLACRGFQ
jgi:hypothetical protein